MDNARKPIASERRLSRIGIYVLTLLLGYGAFILPNLFFGISGIGGGLTGLNLLWCALFQLGAVALLLSWSLRFEGLSFADIGWGGPVWRDAGFGALFALLWTLLQFAWLIPASGGAARADIQAVLRMLEGGPLSLVGLIALGVIGGGIAEELFNRGYVITVLRRFFNRRRSFPRDPGLMVALPFSVLLFALGHLPGDALAWLDILVPTLAYTLLFLWTGRLLASMVAHSLSNLCAIVLVYWLYLPS